VTQFRSPEEAKPGRRRLVGVGAPQPAVVLEPPAAFEDEGDPSLPPLPEIVSHPLSYDASLRSRWRSPLCLVDDYKRETVERWDETEAEIRREHTIARVELVCLKHTSRNWERVDGRFAATTTESELYAACGPGAYSFKAYAIFVDEQTGEENERLLRQFGCRLLPRQHAQPAAAAPAAPPAPPPAPPVATAAFAPAPALPGMPPGMPQPQSVAEWAQMQVVLDQIEQRKQDAEERRAKQRREDAEERRREDDRAAAKRQADLEFQQRWDQMMQQRATDVADSAMKRAKSRRRRRDAGDVPIVILQLQAKAESNATTDPVERLKVGMDAIAEAKSLLGVDDGERNVSSIERAMSIASQALQGHGGKIMEIIGTLVSNRAKLAEMEAQLSQVLNQTRRAPVAPVRQVPRRALTLRLPARSRNLRRCRCRRRHRPPLISPPRL
jgi:hypothetical protein